MTEFRQTVRERRRPVCNALFLAAHPIHDRGEFRTAMDHDVAKTLYAMLFALDRASYMAGYVYGADQFLLQAAVLMLPRGDTPCRFSYSEMGYGTALVSHLLAFLDLSS